MKEVAARWGLPVSEIEAELQGHLDISQPPSVPSFADRRLSPQPSSHLAEARQAVEDVGVNTRSAATAASKVKLLCADALARVASAVSHANAAAGEAATAAAAAVSAREDATTAVLGNTTVVGAPVVDLADAASWVSDAVAASAVATSARQGALLVLRREASALMNATVTSAQPAGTVAVALEADGSPQPLANLDERGVDDAVHQAHTAVHSARTFVHQLEDTVAAARHHAEAAQAAVEAAVAAAGTVARAAEALPPHVPVTVTRVHHDHAVGADGQVPPARNVQDVREAAEAVAALRAEVHTTTAGLPALVKRRNSRDRPGPPPVALPINGTVDTQRTEAMVGELAVQAAGAATRAQDALRSARRVVAATAASVAARATEHQRMVAANVAALNLATDAHEAASSVLDAAKSVLSEARDADLGTAATATAVQRVATVVSDAERLVEQCHGSLSLVAGQVEEASAAVGTARATNDEANATVVASQNATRRALALAAVDHSKDDVVTMAKVEALAREAMGRWGRVHMRVCGSVSRRASRTCCRAVTRLQPHEADVLPDYALLSAGASAVLLPR